MADLLSAELLSFRDDLKGRVVTAEDADYDAVRAACVWNGDIDRRPWVIAQVQSAQDVATAVRFARATGREVSVRGGGHNFSGACIADDAVMIDLGRSATSASTRPREPSDAAAAPGGRSWTRLLRSTA